MKRLVVLISGRGRNLQAIIEAIQCGELQAEIALVLSNKSDAAGLDYAHAAGVASCVIRHADFPTREAFDAEMIAAITPLQPDLVVLAGFMRILSNGFVRAFAGKLINIHPSLLPRYPGLDTHARAIEAGDAEHGASVHWVTEELDGGPVILQGRMPMRIDESAEQLAARLLEEVEVKLYPQALKQLLS
jgi:phosphoribosylglycinamide formyltransferase-1